jgi:ribosome-associated protein
MSQSDVVDDNNEEEFVSKTQLKQEARDLVDLGKKLVDLTPAKLKPFQLDDELMEAITLAQKINRKKDGFRRQLSFIGKLLRSRDNAEDIAEQLATQNIAQKQAVQAFHQLEQTRDKLVAQGDDAISELLDKYPELDRQRLRQWVRQAKKQAEQNKPPRASREIFQYLKAHL